MNIHLEFNLSESFQNQVRLCRKQLEPFDYWGRKILNVVSSLFCISGGIIMIFKNYPHDIFNFVCGIIIGIAGIILFPLSFEKFIIWDSARDLKKSPFYNDTTKMTFSDSGLVIQDKASNQHFYWLAITSAIECRGMILLSGNEYGLSMWVPTTELPENQRVLLIELIKSKVKKYEKK